MANAWRKQWRVPGTGGMVSAADSRDIKDNFAKYLENADFSREIDTICKTYGYDLHDLSTNLPDIGKVLSVGFYVFTKVWDGATRVNRITGRLIAQIYNDTDEDPAPIKYRYIDYDFEDKVWTLWSDATEELDIGTTYPDNYKIFWKQYSDGVLRGAAGNLEKSYPIQLRYINRKAIEDNGFFRDYTYGNEHDRREYEGLLFTTDFPRIKAGFADERFSGTPGLWQNQAIKTIIVPVYDGHQIGSYASIEPIDPIGAGAYYTYNYGRASSSLESIALHLRLNWIPRSQNPEYGEMPRLSGINLYYSAVNAEGGVIQGLYPYWRLLRHIDIRRGGITVESLTGASMDQGGGIWRIESSAHSLPSNTYNDLWAEIMILEGTYTGQITAVERYRITDSGSTTDGMYIEFTASPDTNLVDDYPCNVNIKECWRELPDPQNYFYIKILSLGNEDFGEAPDWLPDPNKIDDPTYECPQMSGNYAVCEEFEERNFFGQIYFDDEKKLKMVGYSNPKNHDFAGYDIIADYINLPLKGDDENMGFGQSLNILSIFSKYDIFKYNFESGAPVLMETPYNVGLVAKRSLVTLNGIHWFLGRKLQNVSIFRYDGIHEPQDVGKPIKDQLDDIFEYSAGLDLEGSTVGWYDNTSNQYRISFNCYIYPPPA